MCLAMAKWRLLPNFENLNNELLQTAHWLQVDLQYTNHKVRVAWYFVLGPGLLQRLTSARWLQVDLRYTIHKVREAWYFVLGPGLLQKLLRDSQVVLDEREFGINLYTQLDGWTLPGRETWASLRSFPMSLSSVRVRCGPVMCYRERPVLYINSFLT